MRTGVSMVGIIVAVAIGSSSVIVSATPGTNLQSTTNTRINAMMNRLDRFEARMDRQDARLYVNRDRTGVHVAQSPESRTSRNNR